MSKTTPPIHTLRAILRHLKTKCPSSAQSATNMETKTGSLRSQILSQYRGCKDLSPTSSEAMNQRKLAYHYSNLIADLTERQKLYELDASAETQLSGKEMSRRAAARAGLQMPESFQG